MVEQVRVVSEVVLERRVPVSAADLEAAEARAEELERDG